MIDLDAWRYRLTLGLALMCLFGAGWLAYENHTLTQTNAELAHLVSVKLDSMEVVILRADELRRESMEALVGDGPRGFVGVLTAEEK